MKKSLPTDLNEPGHSTPLILLALALLWPVGCSDPPPVEAPPLACELNGSPVAPGETVYTNFLCQECSCTLDLRLDCRSVICRDAPDASPDLEDEAHAPELDDAALDVDLDAAVEVDAEEADAEIPDVPEDLICQDVDLDGFFDCVDPRFPGRSTEIDCDDRRYASQPGGYEFPDNAIDDDCDGEVDEEVECNCEGGSEAERLLAAMGLCGPEVISVTRVGASGHFGVEDVYQGGVHPRRGGCLGIISTGLAFPTPPQGFLGGVQPGDELSFRTFDDPEPGGSGQVYDLAQVVVELRPPRNALGLRYSFMFLSAEWPEFLCLTFNDTFYAILESSAVEGGRPTNISFDRDSNDVTVNVGFFEHPDDWTTDLSGTLFGRRSNDICPEPHESVQGCSLPEYCSQVAFLEKVGSGSGWLTTQAPIHRGEETIRLTFSIHDEGDGILDSVVLLDDFQWLPRRTSVGTIKDQQ